MTTCTDKPANKLKGAFAGFGNIAVNGHLPAYRNEDRITITAVADPMPQAAEECRQLIPGAMFFRDVPSMLEAAELDFVDIATPPGTHAENIMMALESGCHVLCEKPLVLNTTDYQEISQLKQSRDLVVYTVHNWRYASILQKASNLVSSGAAGRVKKIIYTVIRTRPSISAGENSIDDNWRLKPEMAGGGILADHGWHAFYMVNEWMGSAPQKVECTLENRKYKDIPLEDTATVYLEYQDAQAEIFFTWAGDKRSNNVVIQGSEGVLRVDDDRLVVENGGGREEFVFSQPLSQGSHHPDWYGAVVADFIAEVENPKLRGRNFHEAGWCQHIMEKCNESHRDKSSKELEHPDVTG